MKGSNSIPRELMDSLMLSIVSFMNQAGMRPSEIEDSFRLGIGDLASRSPSGSTSPKRRKGNSTAIGCDTIAGAVLRAWHRDPDYLDELANPLPLALIGQGRTLTSLVKSQDGNADVAGLVEAMHGTGLVRKLGARRFLPTTSAATINQMHPFAVDHVVKTVLRLVETVTGNMQLIDSKHSLVERYAHVPDLDAKEARAFSEFSRQQGAACLEAIEDWLEARRKRKTGVRSSSRESLSAGMHVFAYIEQIQPKGKHRSGQAGKLATSSRATRA